jgi:hypothetical protein
MEGGLLPPEPVASASSASSEIDARGWLVVIVAMVAIGWWSHRPVPAPVEPIRIPTTASELWMADALPGIGAKTREAHWRHLRAGAISELPERARAIARQIFDWPVVNADQSSGSARHQRQ